jgi:type VI secretion system secreted protein VgrG
MVPQFWLLTRRAQSRIFQQITVPDILRKVLEGLDVVYEIQGTFPKRDYCVQYRETDFNFASRLMEEEGIYYFFKHLDGGHKMVLANSPQSHPDLAEGSKLKLGGKEPAEPSTLISIVSSRGRASVFTPRDSGSQVWTWEQRSEHLPIRVIS